MVTHEGYDRDGALMHLFHWLLFELRYTSGPQRLALYRAAAADPATSALDPLRMALGGGADLIARHASIAVYMTEMFGILKMRLQRATAALPTETSNDCCLIWW